MVRLLEPGYCGAGANLLAPVTPPQILMDCPQRVDADSFCGYYEHDFQKSWKDKQGTWQDQSISLKGREILAVQEALTAAFIDSFDALEGDDE